MDRPVNRGGHPVALVSIFLERVGWQDTLSRWLQLIFGLHNVEYFAHVQTPSMEVAIHRLKHSAHQCQDGPMIVGPDRDDCPGLTTWIR